jgi:aspartyl protease family protein
MKKHQIAFFVSLIFSAVSAQALAMNDNYIQGVKVLGLFKNMAVLNVNDQRLVMHVGDKQHGNMRLLAANSEKAVFEIKGRRIELSMSDTGAIQTNLPVSGGHMAQLISNGGLYSVTGAVNGQLADFVVDTGASYVTMSPQQAKALRLDFSHGRKIMMNTANGKATAHVFTVKSIRIGGIELHDVDAAVMNNLSSSKILLGMSFLDHVDMKHGPGLMVLRQRT